MLKVVRVTSDSVTLQWNAPYSDGGSEITRYVVLRQHAAAGERWEEAGRVAGAAATSFTVQRLREGAPYHFAVYAVNRAGSGDRIETARPVTPKRLISTSCRLILMLAGLIDITHYDLFLLLAEYGPGARFTKYLKIYVTVL